MLACLLPRLGKSCGVSQDRKATPRLGWAEHHGHDYVFRIPPEFHGWLLDSIIGPLPRLSNGQSRLHRANL